MDRRKFLKLSAILPLVFWGREVEANMVCGPALERRKIVLLETTIAGVGAKRTQGFGMLEVF